MPRPESEDPEHKSAVEQGQVIGCGQFREPDRAVVHGVAGDSVDQEFVQGNECEPGLLAQRWADRLS